MLTGNKSSAQNIYNNWYFGKNGGITFNTSPASAVNLSRINTQEGCASISDGGGNLLFYSDGVNIWDRTHTVMPNGNGFLGGHSSTAQSALIVPMPGDNTKFYVFCLQANTQPQGELRYSVVDMTLNSGKGDVIASTKATLLSSGLTEKLVSANASDCGIWVITHQRNNDRFEARLVTAAGIGSPVYSDAGSIHTSTPVPPVNYNNLTGVMKISRNNQKLALATLDCIVELFDFNQSTGIVSNAISLPFVRPSQNYGVCFSPDNTKLYVTAGRSGTGGYDIFQYDISSNSTPVIIATKTLVGHASAPAIIVGDMQIGPDGRLYFNRPKTNFLGIIPFPNLAVPACGFIQNGLSLGPLVIESEAGLPNEIRTASTAFSLNLGKDTTLCPGENLTLTAPLASTYLWSTGATTQSIQVLGTNKYWVRITSGSCTLSDTIQVTFTRPVIDLGRDTALCAREALTLSAGQASSYLWSTGATGQHITVATPGEYWVKATSGSCFSTDTIQVMAKAVRLKDSSATICAGQTFTLPWGVQVGTSDTYRDTIRYVAGCDSLISTFHLTVKTAVVQTTPVILCSGQSYTLPWGMVVNIPGIYRDTLQDGFSCDSLIRIFDVKVNAPQALSLDASICSGQQYTLPSGTAVSTSGIYRDTVRYLNGCDSLIRVVQLSVRTTQMQNASASICAGESYTLAWGPVVSGSGIYRDTLRYKAGCDSVIRTVDLLVKTFTVQTTSATVCKGQGYTLPWGAQVSISGTYHDTLKYHSGCDSVRRTVTLTVQDTQVEAKADTICNGASYSLPWGQVVTAPGIYRDTLHYQTGCDSLRREVQLVIQQKSEQINDAIICEGSNYTLPWGQVVSTTGLYADTLYTAIGCDSVVRKVNLLVKAVTKQATTATICSGHNYTLPWGTVVTTSGVYSDTMRYANGCDSLIRSIALRVTAPAVSSSKASICSGEQYILPWGVTISNSGIYRDTLRTSSGCDSLIMAVSLDVRQTPQVTLSKSNDVDCMLGTAVLTARGGSVYSWTPLTGIDNPSSRTPVVSPPKNTVYVVTVTASNGCSTKDSMEVKVTRANPENGYLVPSAFTPNNDGKNDCFGVLHWGDVKNLKLTVFNRWGEIVFQTTHPGDCWDGMYKGKPQRTDAFVYIVTADTNCGPVLRKGTLTLLR